MSVASSNRAYAVRTVKCKFLKDLKEISTSTTGDQYLMLKTDLDSKLEADGFQHFSLMSDSLERKNGKLVPIEDDREFLSLAVESGYQADDDEEVATEFLHQQSRVISSVLISRLGKFGILALHHPIGTIGRAAYLLRGLKDILNPPAICGVNVGLLWGTLDSLLCFDAPPSKVNLQEWCDRLDCHLMRMQSNKQEVSDQQLLGRIMAQMQRFSLDKWSLRAEAMQTAMLSTGAGETATWDAFKSRILDLYNEDQRMKKLQKEVGELYMEKEQDQDKDQDKRKSRVQIRPEAGAKEFAKEDRLCYRCGKSGHLQRDCWLKEGGDSSGKSQDTEEKEDVEIIAMVATLSNVSDRVLEESRTSKSGETHELPAINKNNIAKKPGGSSWSEYPFKKKGAPRSLHLANVEEKDVSSHTCLVTRMQQKPAKSRQKRGAWTPSEGESATDSEELSDNDCGEQPQIRRKNLHLSNPSPDSGGENSVRARNCKRVAAASAIKEGNVEMKLKIPNDGDTKEEDASKSSQDGSGAPTPDTQTPPKEVLRNLAWVQASNWVKLPSRKEVSSTIEKLNQEGQIEKYQSPWLGGNLKQSSGKLKKGSELGISGKNRYETCTRFLKDLGFKKAGEGGAVFYVDSTYENALQVQGDFKISLIMYVDDLVMFYDKEDAYKALLALLQDKFGISQEEDARIFVGAQVSYD